MALDTDKMESLLIQMLGVIRDSKETPVVEEAPKKKRGRPKGSKNVVEPVPVAEASDGLTHQIKGKRQEVSRKPLAGQKNLFNPADYKTCEDEGSSEWNRLKDGGIVRSQKRTFEVECQCEECNKKFTVLKELAREGWKCDRCVEQKIKK